MPAFTDFFKAVSGKAKVTDLRPIYGRIRESFAELPAAASASEMTEALRAFEADHQNLCELTRSEDEVYGFTKGSNRLEKYIEWTFVPAVKDASTEQLEAKKTFLGTLLERTVRSKMSFSESLAALRSSVAEEYRGLLNANQNTLDDLSASLSARLREWAHPDARLSLSWRDDPSRNISIEEPLAEVAAGGSLFQGSLARSGHGFQRSFLLALLVELAGCRDTGNPRLLLACEEPEIYQHPPQAKYLSSVLQKLSGANAQVIVSTHSPYFVSARGFRDVRTVRQELAEDQPIVRAVNLQDLSELLAQAQNDQLVLPPEVEFKIEQALEPTINEMFFSSVLVLVESPEDFAYLSTYFTLTGKMEEYRRLGCHIIPASGKSRMIRPLAVAKMLGIPTFVVFDADGNVEKPDQRSQHERDNLALLRLCSVDNPIPFPAAIFQTDCLVMWPTTIGAVIKNEFGQEGWTKHEMAVRTRRAILDVAGLEKNPLLIGLTLTEAFEHGQRSAILDGVCNQIISFARTVRASQPAARRFPAPVLDERV